MCVCVGGGGGGGVVHVLYVWTCLHVLHVHDEKAYIGLFLKNL